MPTTKNTGNSSRGNENSRKTGPQPASSSNNDRNKDLRSNTEKQGGQMPKTNK